MSLTKQPTRNERVQRSGSRGSLVNAAKYPPEVLINAIRAFNRQVFLHEVGSSVSQKESCVAITVDEEDSSEITRIASSVNKQTFLIVGSTYRKRFLAMTQKIPVFTLKEAIMNIGTISDNSCIVIDNLWEINCLPNGPRLEQLIIVLGKLCTFVFVSKPISNLSFIVQWMTTLFSSSPKVIEAPIERTSVACFLLSQNPTQTRLVRNTALLVDSISLDYAIKGRFFDHPSPSSVYFAVDEFLAAGLGPVLVIFPTVSHLRNFLVEYPNSIPLISDVPIDHIMSEISSFSISSDKIMLTTTKIAESIYIPAQTVVLSSQKKYDGHNWRDMEAVEFHHLSRCAGRSGIDPRGYFITTIHDGTSRSTMYNTLMTTAPSLSSVNNLNEITYLSSIFGRVIDMSSYMDKTFSCYSQVQRIPQIQEQITTLSSQIPPDSIAKKCLRLFDLETAITSLCTHPLNIRKLLVNGRAVRVRSIIGDRSWGICFGDAKCGTITVAMKGIPNRGRPVEDDEKSLITLPVHEIVAISDTISPLQRQQLLEIEDSDTIISQNYPLYRGNDLKIGVDRLSSYHSEMQELLKSLEAPLNTQWSIFGELVVKHQVFRERIKVLEEYEGSIILPSLSQRASLVKMTPSKSNGVWEGIIISSGISKCYLAKKFITMKLFETSSTLQSIAILSCLVSFQPRIIPQLSFEESEEISASKRIVNEILYELDDNDDSCTQAMDYIVSIVSKNYPECSIGSYLDWERSCFLYQIYKISRKFERRCAGISEASMEQSMRKIKQKIEDSTMFKTFYK